MGLGGQLLLKYTCELFFSPELWTSEPLLKCKGVWDLGGLDR